MFLMPRMRDVQLDLGLLVPLDALLSTGSVSGAAERLHLSQPAVSRTLGRIRRATGDAILVRSGRTMVPTPFAESIRQEVHDLVRRAGDVLAPVRELDLATLERVFTVRVNDALAVAVLPSLLPTIRAQAPGVVLRVLAEPDGPSDPAELGTGLDAIVSDEVFAHGWVEHEVIASDDLVVVGTVAVPDLPAFAAADHVVVSRRGRTRHRTDDRLAEQGLHRRVVLTVPTVAAALAAVAASDLLTTAPRSTVRGHPGLVVSPPPFPTGPVRAVLSWHARSTQDPAHAWMRRVLIEAVTAGLITPRSDETSGPTA